MRDMSILKEMPETQPRIEHREGTIARSIEQQTAKLPSDTWLWCGVAAIGTSLCCELIGKKDLSRFFGQWVPTFLLIGIYNKIVKEQGSEGT